MLSSRQKKQSPTRNPRSNILIEHQTPQQRTFSQSASRPLHKKVLSISVMKHPSHLDTSSHSARRSSPKPRQPDLQIPNPVVRKSTKSFPPIQSYSVSTHHGLFRLINQDKISIHLGRIAVFAVFDGYAGSMASDFLKDRMVIELLKEKRTDMENLLNEVFQRTDGQLVEQLRVTGDKSGSSALLCLISQGLIYVANVGTSFAFGKASKDGKIIRLSNQHNCENPTEYSRVTSAGGRIFQTKVSLRSAPDRFIEGPLRIHPFGLTVTRTMGNIQAKQKLREHQRSDTSQIIISKPQIRYMKVQQLDWACLCSQGLLNTLTPTTILQITNSISQTDLNPHDYLERCVQQIMKSALKRGCRQNATIVLILFKRITIEEPSKQARQIITKKISLKYIGGRSTVTIEKS